MLCYENNYPQCPSPGKMASFNWPDLANMLQCQTCIVTVPGRNIPRKKNKPVVFLLPELPTILYNVENISKKIKSILEELKIDFKVLYKKGNNLSLDIWTAENTWSNQRRKRRLMKKLRNGDAKKTKLNGTETIKGISSDTCKSGDKSNDIEEIASKDVDAQKMVESTSKSSLYMKINSEEYEKGVTNENQSNESRQPQSALTLNSTNPNTSMDPKIVVHAFLKLCKKGSDILLEMEFLNGTAGKEGLHQIVQYIKNNWK